MSATIIQCNQLTPGELDFAYQGKPLDCAFHQGEVTSIIGPDYSGKGHWARTICGLEPQAGGEVVINGVNTRQLTADDWVMSRRKVAYLHADTALLSAANGLINTMIPALYHRLDEQDKNEILAETALDLLEQIDPEIDLDELPAYLSREHVFKIAVARALLLKPDILVLNNPFAHFNNSSKIKFQAFLKTQVNNGLALLLVTYDIHYALKMSDRIIFVDRKNLYQFDSKQAILNSDIAAVDEFMTLNT